VDSATAFKPQEQKQNQAQDQENKPKLRIKQDPGNNFPPQMPNGMPMNQAPMPNGMPMNQAPMPNGMPMNQTPQMQPPVGARSITTVCTSCGKQHQVPLTSVGSAMNCTGCNQPFVVLPKDNDKDDFGSPYDQPAFTPRPQISGKFIALGIVGLIVIGAIGFYISSHNTEGEILKAKEQLQVERQQQAERQRQAEEEQRRIDGEIEQRINTAMSADTAEESIAQLEKIIEEHPSHSSISRIRTLIAEKRQYIQECNIVRGEIQKARNASNRSYAEACGILNNIIRKYPSNYYTNEARDLLAEYEEQASRKKCFFCVGDGYYIRGYRDFFGDPAIKKYKCPVCNGNGIITSQEESWWLSRLVQCPDCKSTPGFDPSLYKSGFPCHTCNGAAYLVKK